MITSDGTDPRDLLSFEKTRNSLISDERRSDGGGPGQVKSGISADIFVAKGRPTRCTCHGYETAAMNKAR
jgi:hypothetical protein